MADNAMTKIKKNKFIPFLDVDKDTTFAANNWKRIDYSTIFTLTMNEQEEDVDYICFADPVTEINSNKPELPQEIALYEGNPMYDFMLEEFYNMPTGSECKVPYLICFGGSDTYAWQGICTITSKVLDTVAGKITFSMKMGGDTQKGTYTITDGVPTFVPANANANAEDDEDDDLISG